jgi:phosphotriesterase-related protein
MENDDYDNLKIILWLILFLVFGIIIITCKPESRGYVMTVNGPEHPGKMGITLTHEHILVDFIGADSTGYFRWNRDSVIRKVIPFILDIKKRGVKTFIDCTPAYLGRDPLILKELSKEAGINFITNTGYYGAMDNKFIPRDFFSSDASQIANLWIDEFTNGIEETGIRPGFIKIGVAPADTLSQEHRKLVTAAALTHLKTGLVIASHTGPDKPAFEQMAILREMGVDPSAFIWVHAQRGTIAGNIEAAKTAAWISLDNVRNRPDLKPGDLFTIDWYADRIMELKKNGLLSKILLSHDSGWYDPAKPGGGTLNGYTDIFDFLIPALKARGMTDVDIFQILIKNPAEAFRVRIRSL